MAEEWKALSAKEKEPFEKAYEKDKERFVKEKQDYEEKKKTSINPPKRPMTAYFCFMKERRATLLKEQPNIKNTEISKVRLCAKLYQKAADEWEKLAPEAKAPYEKIAKENKEKYLIEVKAYKEAKGEKPGEEKEEQVDGKAIVPPVTNP